MALAETVKETIVRIAREYGVRRIWLFGSSLDPSIDEPNDIDLAVEGVSPERFYEFYAKLGRALPSIIDLIDMESDDPMRHIVRDRGVVLYE